MVSFEAQFGIHCRPHVPDEVLLGGDALRMSLLGRCYRITGKGLRDLCSRRDGPTLGYAPFASYVSRFLLAFLLQRTLTIGAAANGGS